MRNHVSGQFLCSAQKVHVLEVDDWHFGRAELLDVDAEEACHGGAELHAVVAEDHCHGGAELRAVEAENHCHGGAELHAVEIEEQCQDQVVHQCHDELGLNIAGYHDGYWLDRFDGFDQFLI